MKTLALQQQRLKHIALSSVFFFMAFLNTDLIAQNKAQKTTVEVKGMVKNNEGPLAGVNVYVKNSNTGTVTKANGSFKFSSKLAVGDTLIFSYLGYVKQAIVIKDNIDLSNIILKEAPLDVLSALNSNKAYKSKRRKL